MEFNGQKIPTFYTFCASKSCPQAETCMRHQVLRQLPSTCETLKILNPNYADTVIDNGCDLYVKFEKRKIAYGFKHMFDNLPFNVAKAIHSQIEAAFCHTSFYRCKKGTQPTPPDKQAIVKGIFEKYGITEEPQYDKIVEEYSFE